MPADKNYRMKYLESKVSLKTEPRPAPVRKVKPVPTTSAIVKAFKQSPGHEEILARIPRAATVRGWDEGTQVACFCVCVKTGTAKYLDIWDNDHFDGFTDMQHDVANCRAWFSHKGYTTWGSGETKTGRINCYFNADVAGDYSCVVHLASYPSSSSATVECLIDNSSFGNLPFTGTVIQPHFHALSAGGHSFRIRQVSGSFFFYTLVVYRF